MGGFTNIHERTHGHKTKFLHHIVLFQVAFELTTFDAVESDAVIGLTTTGRQFFREAFSKKIVLTKTVTVH